MHKASADLPIASLMFGVAFCTKSHPCRSAAQAAGLSTPSNIISSPWLRNKWKIKGPLNKKCLGPDFVWRGWAEWQQRQLRPKTRCSRPSVHSIASFSASIGSILKGMLKFIVQGHNSCFIPWTGQVPSFWHTAYLSWRKRLSEHLVETGKSLAKTASGGRLGQLMLKDLSATRGTMERVSDFSLCGSYSERCIIMLPESFTVPIVGMCIVLLSTVWASKCTSTSVASGKPLFNWNCSRSVADCKENSSMNSFICIRALVAPCQSGDIEAKPWISSECSKKITQKMQLNTWLQPWKQKSWQILPIDPRILQSGSRPLCGERS